MSLRRELTRAGSDTECCGESPLTFHVLANSIMRLPFHTVSPFIVSAPDSASFLSFSAWTATPYLFLRLADVTHPIAYATHVSFLPWLRGVPPLPHSELPRPCSSAMPQFCEFAAVRSHRVPRARVACLPVLPVHESESL